MQSVQRQFGRFMKRSADDNQVALLLKDFEQIDKLLDKIVDSTKAWRDAWSSTLIHQDRMFTEFEGLYAPMIGSSDAADIPVLTPEATMARTRKLKVEYEDLKRELLDEIAAIEDRMISPASQAKECLTPFKKSIKKREDRKLDYERHHSRVDNYTKRTKRSDRENAAMVKAEQDLAKATEEYHALDENLRQQLPPFITAVFSLLPRLLSAQIEIQNSLLAQYYTVIYTYCEQEQLPSDPPQSMDQIVTQWEQAYSPVQQQIDNFACLTHGKAARSHSQSPNDRRPSNTPKHVLNRFRSNHNLSSQQSSDAKSIPAYSGKPSLGARSKSTPGDIIYDRLEQAPPAFRPSLTDAHITTISQVTHEAAAKKKPPPPPPPRPRNASNETFVTALYDFGGQSGGDLSFQQGDRIRVLNRTDSTDDWWDGELHGVQGSFPANYVELA
ncbi:hypothetical protein BJX99DRAFT_244209 [Aspergillus californicus]